jgi:hypothetical protein
MSARTLIFFAIAAWVLSLIYFLAAGAEVFMFAVIFPPMAATLIYASYKRRFFTLTVFLSFAFVAHAFSPAFFFMNKDEYSYAGFSAIRDFDFNVYEFAEIYANVFLLLILIVMFSILLNRLFFNSKTAIVQNDLKTRLPVVPTARGGKAYDIRLIVFIICGLLPLNALMYVYGIGISTVEPQQLPFKLVGISFYLRAYVAPVLLTWMYLKSRRGLVATLFILLYAALVGVLSLSKGAISLACLPVIIFSVLDNHRARLIVSSLYFLLLYSAVSWARQFVFVADVGTFELVQLILDNVTLEIFSDSGSLASTIGQLSARLYGAQSVVLAYQYNLSGQFAEIANFFLGVTETYSYIVNQELFGLEPAEGVVVGAGIGYLATMILLANKSLIVLALLAFISAGCFVVSEAALRKYITSGNTLFRGLGYALGFLMMFFLYDAYIVKFYSLLLLSICGVFMMDFMRLWTMKREASNTVD